MKIKYILVGLLLITLFIISILMLEVKERIYDTIETPEDINKDIIRVMKKDEDDLVVRIDDNIVITERDLAWIRFYDDEMDRKEAMDEAIKKVAVLQAANEKGTKVSDVIKQFDEQLINKYKNQDIPESFLKEINMTKEEYISKIEKDINEISIMNQFEADINTEIINGTFKCDDERISEKISKYNERRKQFEEEETDYDNVSSYRKEIVRDYIKYLISKHKIRYK